MAAPVLRGANASVVARLDLVLSSFFVLGERRGCPQALACNDLNCVARLGCFLA